jgi:hypothetical protein
MAHSVTIDLNGNGFGVNNTTTYNDSASTNPTVALFSNANVDFSSNAGMTSLTIKASGWSATESYSFASSFHMPTGYSITANSGGTLTITNNGGGSASGWTTILDNIDYRNSADVPNASPYRTFTVTGVGSTSGSGTTVTGATDALNVTCFYAGTLVQTPKGEVPVETLKRDDLVLTQDGHAKPISWLGRQTVSTLFADKLRVLPIRIKAGALADNVPARDLLISPDHAVLVGDALIQASALVNGTSIVRETDVPDVFTYYHVEVDDHSLILAENTPVETFVDNVDRLNFDNWAEHQALYPDGRPITELNYPRAKSHRQVPVSIRRMLEGRAQIIGVAREGAAVA